VQAKLLSLVIQPEAEPKRVQIVKTLSPIRRFVLGQQALVELKPTSVPPTLAQQQPSPKFAAVFCGAAPKEELEGRVSLIEAMLNCNQPIDSVVEVKHCLVLQDQIPVYLSHTGTVDNTFSLRSQQSQAVRASSVYSGWMANTLAAQATTSPHDAASLTGAERP